MNGEEMLLRVIGRVRGRMRLQRAVDSAVRACAAGSAAAAAAAGMYRLSGEIRWLAAGIGAVALSAAAGAAAGLARSPGLVAAALAADERFGLKERLTTMVDLSSRGSRGSLARAQAADAVAAAAGRDFARVRPLGLPEAARYVAVILVVAFGIAAMPRADGGSPGPGGALGRAISAAAGGISEAARKVPVEELDPEDRDLVRDIIDASDQMESPAGPADAERARKGIEEWIDEIESKRRDERRLDLLRKALAEARRKIAEAAGEAEPASAFSAHEGPGQGGGGDTAPAGASTALAPARALAEGTKSYPAYAEVLRRYFSGGEGRDRREDRR